MVSESIGQMTAPLAPMLRGGPGGSLAAGLLASGLLFALIIMGCGTSDHENLEDRSGQLRGTWTRDCKDGLVASISFSDELVAIQRRFHADTACTTPIRTERITGWFGLALSEPGRPAAVDLDFRTVAVEPQTPEEAQRLNDEIFCEGAWVQGITRRFEFAKCPLHPDFLLSADLLFFDDKTLKTGKKTTQRTGQSPDLRPLEIDPSLIWNRKLL